jgi:predicted nuclease of predicted toxin-antitoxin system
MQLYADEDIPFPVVLELRQLGHDVLTVQEDGRRGAPDPDVLARAHALGRAILTHNRRHFERLDRQGMPHSGIVSATQDPNNPGALAARIHAALAGRSPGPWSIRINRPSAS